VTTKTCRQCHRTQPLSAFPTHKHMKDGHLNLCRVCKKAADSAAYAKRQATQVTAAPIANACAGCARRGSPKSPKPPKQDRQAQYGCTKERPEGAQERPTCSWLVALRLLAGSSHRKWRGTA
jgi:hypothetical protein